MRGDQLSRQWRSIRAIEASPNGLTLCPELFRFRPAQVFDPATAMFALQPPFLRRQRGLCLFPEFGPLGSLADQTHEAGNRILAVSLLGAEPPGIDNKITFLGQALSG